MPYLLLFVTLINVLLALAGRGTEPAGARTQAAIMIASNGDSLLSSTQPQTFLLADVHRIRYW
jgi:hypothetical protein